MADTSIIDRNGKGSALDATDYDTNVDSMCGIVEEETGATHTVNHEDQNKTIQYNRGTAVTVTLTDPSTIISSLDTSHFKVCLKNIGAGDVTVDPGAVEIDGSAADIVLKQWDSITLHSNDDNTAWDVIARDMSVVDIDGGTIDGVTIGATVAPTVTDLGSVATCDINGGTLDGVPIGGAAPAAIVATTVVANTSLDINGTVVLVGTIDDDTMGTATDTTVATSESIKAYVDSITLGVGQTYNSQALADDTPRQNPSSLKPMLVVFQVKASTSTDGKTTIKCDANSTPSQTVTVIDFESTDVSNDTVVSASIIVPPDFWYSHITAGTNFITIVELR